MNVCNCPKCKAPYERHPLDPVAQELCPACRNAASWDEIKDMLAAASSQSARGNQVPAAVRQSRVAPA